MTQISAKFIVLLLGATFISVGVFTSVFNKPSVPEIKPVERGESSLKVKPGNNLPEATIDRLQGSGNLQGQASRAPQSGNAGASLQPNAGVDSLPKN